MRDQFIRSTRRKVRKKARRGERKDNMAIYDPVEKAADRVKRRRQRSKKAQMEMLQIQELAEALE